VESALANVSMAAIIAAPERHNARYVRVKGFLRCRPDWRALYLHRDDAENGIDESAVWLDASFAGDCGAKDGNYVILEGTFDARRRDEMTAFAGTIRVHGLALWGSSSTREQLARHPYEVAPRSGGADQRPDWRYRRAEPGSDGAARREPRPGAPTQRVAAARDASAMRGEPHGRMDTAARRR
jgi:hypothetical protein